MRAWAILAILLLAGCTESKPSDATAAPQEPEPPMPSYATSEEGGWPAHDPPDGYDAQLRPLGGDEAWDWARQQVPGAALIYASAHLFEDAANRWFFGVVHEGMAKRVIVVAPGAEYPPPNAYTIHYPDGAVLVQTRAPAGDLPAMAFMAPTGNGSYWADGVGGSFMTFREAETKLPANVRGLPMHSAESAETAQGFWMVNGTAVSVLPHDPAHADGRTSAWTFIHMDGDQAWRTHVGPQVLQAPIEGVYETADGPWVDSDQLDEEMGGSIRFYSLTTAKSEWSLHVCWGDACGIAHFDATTGALRV